MVSLTSHFLSLRFYILSVWSWAHKLTCELIPAWLNVQIWTNCCLFFLFFFQICLTHYTRLLASITSIHVSVHMFTCTRSSKGIHVLRSHLVPVVRPLSAAPRPSKKKRAVYVFIREGSTFSSLCLQERAFSLVAAQKLYSCRWQGIILPRN